MGKAVKFQVKLQLRSEVGGTGRRRRRRRARRLRFQDPNMEPVARMHACMYRLAPVRPGWAERRAFAPVFLAFVLRAKVFAAPADPRLVPPRICYHRKGGKKKIFFFFFNADCATDGRGGMLCSERQFPGV